MNESFAVRVVKYLAGAVAVLITIVLVYSTGGAVAVDSLQAMSFRTAVWMALFLATAWMVRPHADD